MSELVYAGPEEHCGCREEHILVNGVDLLVHYEAGFADSYLDFGDDGDAQASLPAPTQFAGRVAALRWASELTA